VLQDVKVSCVVYGQGFCASDKPYFHNFEKRMAVVGWLAERSIEVLLPETELPYPQAIDFLDQEIELARRVDFVVALQPTGTLFGAPTLRSELHDLSQHPELRDKTWVFRPANERFATFDSVVSRLLPEQVLEYAPATYDACKEIRDKVSRIVEVFRLAQVLSRPGAARNLQSTGS